MLENLLKSALDYIIYLSLNIGDMLYDFLIALFIVIINTLIIPLIKKGLKWLSEKFKEKGIDIEDEVNNTIDKIEDLEIKKDEENKK